MAKANQEKVIVGGRQVAPLVQVVSMIDVPYPPSAERGTKYKALYDQVCELKPGAALKATFGSASHATYGKAQLLKMAKRDKQVLSSSRSADGLTRYFWLEKA